jgi:RNA polymerase sigma factor (sigma-70 family)
LKEAAMPTRKTRHPPPTEEEDRQTLVHRLWERHEAQIKIAIRAVANRRGLFDPNAIDDVYGEITRQVLQKAATYDPARSFAAWVIGFVGFVLAERARQTKRRREVAETDLNAAEDRLMHRFAQAQSGLSADERIDLFDWLAQLAERPRRLIELRHLHNFTPAEILAEVGGSSVGAIRTELSRALDTLRGIALRADGGAS